MPSSDREKNSRTAAPLVSVCVLTYRHEKYIAQALDSILAQRTSFDFELLIYDDASPDRTPDIIREKCRDLPPHIRPVLFLQKENLWSRKIPGAAVYMYPAAKGNYVACCEGDDYWTDPLKLQKQVDFLEAHPECTMCAHPGKIIYDDMPPGQSKEMYPGPVCHKIYSRKGYVLMKDMLRGNMLTTASVMYRWKYYGEEFRKVYPDGILPGDWFIHLLHARDGKIGYLPEPMSVYRKHSGGMLSGSGSDDSAHFRQFKDLELAFHQAVFALFAGRKEETRRWEETYTRFLNRMLDCFLSTHDEEALLWFWNHFPDRFGRLLELRYFKSKPNNMWESLGRIIARTGLKEEGFVKTISRFLHRDTMP